MFWFIVISISVLFGGLEYLWFSKYKETILGMEWNWGWVAFFAQILYTIFSFRNVGQTELGAILFFGKPVKEVSSGLVFVPFGICKLEIETRLVIQEELPGNPELIFRGDGETPKGMFPPIRIPFADKPEKGDDPLNKRITAEIVPVIRWRILNYITFLINIGSKEEAKRQMEDVTIALCMRELPQKSVAEALVTLQDFNKKLQKTIEELVGSWGIKVETVQIKLINFHRELNKAIASVAEAGFQKKAVITVGEGERQKRMLEGEGSGLAEKAVLDGRTAGLKAMKNKLGLPSDLVLNAETARAITQNPGQKTVIVGTKGLADLIGIATGIQKTIKTESEA
jgi:regulator of protease activity HflC (stomatin/prohibitin superfamily)